MPRAWTRKDERQYEHVRDGALGRGVRPERAREVAARTVNKQRRIEGRTATRTSRGTGNPNLDLEERPKQELYNRARELGIEGRSSMTKARLIDAIRSRH